MSAGTIMRGRTTSGVRAGWVEWTVFAVAVLAVLFAATWSFGRADVPALRTLTVKVEAGESAWELAQRYPVPGLTTAQTASLILELNDLESGVVPVGAIVNVPDARPQGQLAMR